MKLHFFRTLFLLLCLSGLAHADTITYNGNEIYPFSGRTKNDITAKYLEARDLQGSYRNASSSWYTIPASTKSPYNAGVLTQDTHNTMSAMTNFFRWLTGVKPMTQDSVHSESLQHQALDRNFEFDHFISQDSKPDDMPQELWDIGFECQHNALALGSAPRGAIISWLNEGYYPSSQKWEDYKYGGGVGHRLSLISGYISSVQFGFCGSVTINKGTSAYSANMFEGKFAAFPPPGFMPSEMIMPYESAWHIQTNNEISVTDDVSVTVTDLSSGTSYTCTADNGKLSPFSSSHMIIFAQPFTPDEDGKYRSSYRYSGDYRVEVKGLKEKESGNDAEINYTVSFMQLPPEIVNYSDINMVTGNSLYTLLRISSNTPAEWSLTSGTLPKGISIDRSVSTGGSESWYLGGTPTIAGEYTFTLTASNQYGQDSEVFIMTVENVKPSFKTESLPSASVDVRYSVPVEISGSKPVTWTVSGGTLPPGLTLGTDGKISGTPSEAGEYHFTLTAENAGGTSAKDFVILSRRVKPVINANNLVYDTVDVDSSISYSMQVYAQGSKPITWSISGGNLPDGLTLSADGSINGTPEKAGRYDFTVKAENDLGYDTKSFTITAQNVKPEIWKHTFSPIKAGSRQFITLRADGTKPITWSLAAGKLPDGLILNTSMDQNIGVVIEGTPTAAGTFKFTVRAENQAGYDTKEFEIDILPGNTTEDNSGADDKTDTGDNSTDTGGSTDTGDNNSDTGDNNSDTGGNTDTGSNNTNTGGNTETGGNNTDTGNTSENNSGEIASGYDADKIRSLFGVGGNVPFSELSVATAYYYDSSSIAAELEDFYVSDTGIYLIKNISFRRTIPQGSYLYWEDEYISGSFSCIFLDADGNKIPNPTESALSGASAAVYLYGGRRYSAVITAEYYSENGGDGYYPNRYQENSGSSSSGGGGCDAFVSPLMVFVVLFACCIHNRNIQM